MTLKDYCRSHKVTQTELAAQLGVTQAMVSHWSRGACRVTAEYAIKIERVTGGAVSRSELRPDIFWI